MREKAYQALLALGGDPELLRRRELPLFADADELAVAHVSESGREHLLIPVAARRWRALRVAAEGDGVILTVISGFRSFQRQFDLVEAKCAAGESIDAVLAIMAPPGCSEHHTGRALDVGTPGGKPLSESFADTAAYAWLAANAGDYGFALSFPRDNPFGYTYEPWHWCYQPSLDLS